jgi:hypothetical protein
MTETNALTYNDTEITMKVFKFNSTGHRWKHHDTQHNDIQHNDTQHNDTQHNGLVCDTQHKRHWA